MRVFLAGATGAVGVRLAPLLVGGGHEVVGATRYASKCSGLAAAGLTPVVVDVFDADGLARAVLGARPDVIVHQLTDLPARLDPTLLSEALVRNARIRREGTLNLVRAAQSAGTVRMVAQSIAWVYAPGPEPHREEDALDLDAVGDRGVTVGGAAALEHLVLRSPPIIGVVLRYGRLYGPGTGARSRPDAIPLHVDAAAMAAFLAIDAPSAGIYNIAEQNAIVSTERAARDLGWRADFRLAAAPGA